MIIGETLCDGGGADETREERLPKEDLVRMCPKRKMDLS